MSLRTPTIQFHVSEDEKKQMVAYADFNGMKLSTYLRWRAIRPVTKAKAKTVKRPKLLQFHVSKEERELIKKLVHEYSFDSISQYVRAQALKKK